jgi:hypothetical protein
LPEATGPLAAFFSTVAWIWYHRLGGEVARALTGDAQVP